MLSIKEFMNTINRRSFGIKILVLSAVLVSSICPSFPSTFGDFDFSVSGIFKPEMVYGNAFSRLNDEDDLDKALFWRHTFDLNFYIQYGKNIYDHVAAQLYFTLRNRAIWGSSENLLRTTESRIKLLEVVQGEHTHGIPRHLFWMREAWLEFQLCDILNLPFSNQHSFKIGAFPFQLGRGIALGDAYAVGPDLLGFFNEGLVDQYAYGALLTNEILPALLYHDFYVALLESKCSLTDVNAKIRGQEYGRLDRPERGFGRINFVVANRLNWIIINNPFNKLNIEGYFLYNHDPEQKVEFKADASTRLATIGIAGEFIGQQWEAGFDGALNFGRQMLLGWDRNAVTLENRNGQVVIINDHAQIGNALTGAKALYVPGSDVQTIIDRAERSARMNGKQIGTVDGVAIFNAVDRFRDPGSRKLNGWMFVADGAYWPIIKELQVAFAAGIASGVDNPICGEYDGFVGLQEEYSGKRVKSAFLLGGAGRIKRFLSQPEDATQPDKYLNSPISGFTNLVFTGTAINWVSTQWSKMCKINPNVLAYWQQTRTGNARNFLGVESNLFASCSLLKNLDVFMIGSVFFPGGHYTDRKGTIAVTQEQEDIADESDVTGFEADPIPRYGDNIAFTLNIGMKFTF